MADCLFHGIYPRYLNPSPLTPQELEQIHGPNPEAERLEKMAARTVTKSIKRARAGLGNQHHQALSAAGKAGLIPTNKPSGPSPYE